MNAAASSAWALLGGACGHAGSLRPEAAPGRPSQDPGVLDRVRQSGRWRPHHPNASATTSPGSSTVAPACTTSRSRPPGSWLARCRSTASACSRWTRPRSCRPTRWSRTGCRRRRSRGWPRSRCGGEDFNAFAALARSERRAASLSEATDGELERSRRHRELRRPHGLRRRAARRARQRRGDVGRPRPCCAAPTAAPFEPGDTELVASLSALPRGGRAPRAAALGAACGRTADEATGRARCSSPPTARSRRRTRPPTSGSPSCRATALPPAVARRGEPRAQHRDGQPAPGATARARVHDGLRALAARARLDARRRRRRADGRDASSPPGHTSSRR